jgi:DNA sulfur modification protein DndC
LVVESILSISPEDRQRRETFIVYNDTLVESPVFQTSAEGMLDRMTEGLAALQLPVRVLKTRPEPHDTFWVCMLGKGYPAPNRSFRWCVDRLKIKPTSKFIRDTVSASGEAILLLGVRKAESAARARRIEKYSNEGNNARLVPHNDVSACSIFRPIMDLLTEEVWAFLDDNPPPWGGTHGALKELYEHANGGDWPFVVDETGAPTSSPILARFGCWTCTVVDRDRSLEALQKSGHGQVAPLVQFRDRLKEVSGLTQYRCKIRRTGQPGLGPLTLEARQMLLDELLDLQESVGIPLIAKHDGMLVQEQWARDEFTHSMRLVEGKLGDHAHCPHGWTCAECTCRH